MHFCDEIFGTSGELGVGIFKNFRKIEKKSLSSWPQGTKIRPQIASNINSRPIVAVPIDFTRKRPDQWLPLALKLVLAS